MKKTITILFATMAGIASVCAQDRNDIVRASGNIQENNVTLSGTYDEIDVTGSVTVILTDGTPGSIRVKAADNIIPHLNIFVNDNTLHIGYKAGYSYRDSTTTVYVPITTLEEINISGKSHVHSDIMLRGKELDITLMGAAMFEGSANVEDLSLELLGSSSCNITATCTDVEIDATGTSSLKGNLTVADEADIEAAGSSSIEIHGSCSEMELDMGGNARLNAVKFTARDIKGTVAGNATADVTNTGRLTVNCTGTSTLIYDSALQINDSRAVGTATIKARNRR